MNNFCEDSTNKDKEPQKNRKSWHGFCTISACRGNNVIYASKKRFFRHKSTQDCQFIIIFAKILHIFE